ncbi:MAG TPA: GNAT family N-acetyltransferase [Chloroflexota bacterium]|nr:GNAT family N-acetyltransferase [Chloroflexota bacterium]
MSEHEAPPRRPSLQMLRPDLEGLPSLDAALAALPARYHLQTYRPGDEAAWAEIMNTGEMGAWDVDRTQAELTGRPVPQFDPDGLFFVVDGSEERPIGSACAWLLDPGETETGVLHMVCVLPEHRGHRLSYVVCLAVLHRLRARGYRRVRLTTHEWRLGAVKVYLQLGFQPVYTDPMHPAQWEDVLHVLGWPAPIQPISGPL